MSPQLDIRDVNNDAKTTGWRVAAGLLFAGAVLCLAAGVALPFIFGGVFSGKLEQMLPIARESAAYNAWLSSELRFQVWLWNITNPWSVLHNNETARLEQVGPFTFAETRTRSNATFFANHTVSYDDVRTYYFLPEESVGSMRDYVITNVNLPYLAVAMKLKHQSYSIRSVARNYFAGFRGGIFLNRTAEDLLIGYQDAAIEKIRPLLRYAMPSLRLPRYFGLLVGKNGTAKGTALVGTGRDSLSNISRIQRWNGQSRLTVWPGDFGNSLADSSDGSMFSPPVTPVSSLRVFTPDLCRSADLTYAGDSAVRDIPVLRFRVAKTAMMSAAGNADNAAFCTPRCLDSGVLNLSLCLPGNPPIVASAPHFYGAPAYSAGVTMLPTSGAFELDTRLEVEPNTGLMLRAARRMQINAALEHIPGFPDTEPFGSLLIMPYAWLNESGSIGPEAADRFRLRVLRPLRLATLLSWLLLAAGLALLVLACVVCSLEIRLRVARRLSRSQRREGKEELASLYCDPVAADAGKGERIRSSSSEKQPPGEVKDELQTPLSSTAAAERDDPDPEKVPLAALKSLPETDIV